MTHNRMHLAVAAALISVLALAGCKKKEAPVVMPPATTEPAPMSAPLPTTAPAATASVTSVDLGNAVGPDMKVMAPASTFAAKDTIYAAVSTSTSDAMATVPSKLSAKWTFQDGQTVNEENVDANLTGNGVTDFKINSPKGFPVGKYKVEISLNGAVAQSRDFEIK